MRRRTFLTGIGTVTILVAGGQVWRAFGQSTPEIPDGPAFEPWRTWRTDMQDGPFALVHAAILSANAFNSQPWLFRVSKSNIEMYADTKRNLGAFDPYLRELFFSLGCGLENLLLAASANQFQTRVTFAQGKLKLPSGAARPELAARIDLSSAPGGIRSELFDAIPHRHTNRNLFDASKDLPADFVQALHNLVGSDDHDVRLFLFLDPQQRKTIVDLIWDCSRKFGADPDVAHGTQPWFRATMDQLQKTKDGIYAGESESASYVDLMMSGRIFGLIAVRDRYDRPQTIRAGKVWQRVHLLATARGVAARPANGAVEIIDHERRLKLPPDTTEKLATITGDASWQPTFMFYMGYPTFSATASARRWVQDVILS